MSRTYRRKKGLQEDEWWVLFNWVGSYETSYKRIPIDKYTKEGRELIAKYHSDAQDTMKQVPKWYKVHFLRKPFRAKEKHQLVLAVKYLDEDITFPLVKMAANYYW